jgi:hypothetical protein
VLTGTILKLLDVTGAKKINRAAFLMQFNKMVKGIFKSDEVHG